MENVENAIMIDKIQKSMQMEEIKIQTRMIKQKIYTLLQLI